MCIRDRHHAFQDLNDRYCKHNLVTNKAGEVVKVGLELMIKELEEDHGSSLIINLNFFSNKETSSIKAFFFPDKVVLIPCGVEKKVPTILFLIQCRSTVLPTFLWSPIFSIE